jgi:ABC-2 type transport system permease protein
VIAFVLDHFNLFSLGFPLLPYVANLFFFGVTIAIFINSIILRFGTSAQVLAFGVIFIIQPITAVYYPVSALPLWIQPFSLALPTTYVFEAMRSTFRGGSFDVQSFIMSLALNVAYFLMAWLFFRKMFKSVKKKGLLLKVQS